MEGQFNTVRFLICYNFYFFLSFSLFVFVFISFFHFFLLLFLYVIVMQIFKSLLQSRVGAFMTGDGMDLNTDPRLISDRMKKQSQYQGQGTGTGSGSGSGGASSTGGDSTGTGNGSNSGGGTGMGMGMGGTGDHKARSESMSDVSSPNTKERRRKNLPPVLQIVTTPSAMVCDTDAGENGRSRVPASGKGVLSDYLRDRVEMKGGLPDFGDVFTKSTTVLREKGTRRARVSQCKNLRGFIMGFENDWLLKRGVAVKVRSTHTLSMYLFSKCLVHFSTSYQHSLSSLNFLYIFIYLLGCGKG